MKKNQSKKSNLPLTDSWQEIIDLMPEIAKKIANESDRGAILIGTSYVEIQLEKFILEILPEQSNKYQTRLLNYPGPLSSFSSKIELLYAFRYINLTHYNSLNSLRKIRNKAAHEKREFKLTDYRNDLNSAFGEFKHGKEAIENEVKQYQIEQLTTSFMKLKKIDEKDKSEILEIFTNLINEKELEEGVDRLTALLEFIYCLVLLITNIEKEKKIFTERII
ncbi:MAG: hypothetical protein R2780_13400 [Crocinitomicaceae bacterium]|nr:hypothetical protein [Crocinitomicaceae bacterium]